MEWEKEGKLRRGFGLLREYFLDADEGLANGRNCTDCHSGPDGARVKLGVFDGVGSYAVNASTNCQSSKVQAHYK
jgi:hypothetical protein